MTDNHSANLTGQVGAQAGTNQVNVRPLPGKLAVLVTANQQLCSQKSPTPSQQGGYSNCPIYIIYARYISSLQCISINIIFQSISASIHFLSLSGQHVKNTEVGMSDKVCRSREDKDKK